MSGKKIVEKAAKTIDWEGMSKLLISDNARREFFNLRRAYEEVEFTLLEGTVFDLLEVVYSKSFDSILGQIEVGSVK